ncbi:MAG: MTH1187 family thiamine-binding protein [Armatimonadota bacterium]|nr:MTH1187 family thiamine-binding protein [bacterium]
MLASFSVIPIGAGEELKELVADILSIVDKSGLSYKLGAMQTTLEGEPERVMSVVMECHRRMLELAPRVLTNITIDDRKDAQGRLEGKVKDVEDILGRELSHE